MKSLKNNTHKDLSRLLKIISKDEIENIAREVNFVKRDGKIKPWHFLYLCAFSESNVCKDTLVSISSKLSSNLDKLVSTQALHDRFNNKGVAFLQKIFMAYRRDTCKKC